MFAPGVITEDRPGPQTYGVERVAALSDGVFAIVLTLLVLELKVPVGHGVNDTLIDDLGDNYHVFIGWLISFLVIARIWVIHHAVVAHLARCHIGTIILNFALLAAVSLMPFTAALIGDYRIDEPWSTAFFAMNIAVASVALGLLARHAASEPTLLKAQYDHRLLGWHKRHHLYVLPPVAIAGAGLAFVEPYGAILVLAGEFFLVIGIGLYRVTHHDARGYV
ncbi:MAG: potassium channel family protein [Solirubrobacteraceae bacterium]|jgi:uncharacterized membrane protein|nr:potassium channel family protein [Solirubrobacteraceae bacterium]